MKIKRENFNLKFYYYFIIFLFENTLFLSNVYNLFIYLFIYIEINCIFFILQKSKIKY